MVLSLLEQTPDRAAKLLATLMLPFSVSARNRTLPFTEEMEMAAIFILAESDRKKATGLIVKKAAEELTFIAKSCYPIWLVPWNSMTLLFDGVSISRYTIQYETLPDVKAFISDVKGSATTRQAYSAALQDHLHYFETMKRVEEKVVPGLIASPEMHQDFKQFLMEGDESDQVEIKDVCLHPNIDEASISSTLNDLSELKTTLEHDTKSLHDAMRLLNNATKQHVDEIREEARRVQSDLSVQIAEARSTALEGIQVIHEKYDTRILKTSQRFDREIQRLDQERIKLEKAQERAIGKIERCDTEIQDSKMRKDAASERRWKDEKETWKREASTLRKTLEALDKQIEQTESQKKIEVSNVRAEFNAQSEDAMKEVRELEATKESKAQLSQQEIKALEGSTATILSQLDALTKKKRNSLEELDAIGMEQPRRRIALAYVPFYLSCLRVERKRKYLVYPPSVVGSMKTTTKLKGMLGLSKLGSLFQPRSRAVAGILNHVTELAERDPVFEKELYDTGVQTNILNTSESREKISKGLNDLRKEEWMSINEFQTLGGLLKA